MGHANDSLTTQLPNPLTPMAFLPPVLAYETTVTMYLVVGATAVMIWDILNNLRSDYIMLFKQRIGGPTITYFISRFATLAFIMGTTIFTTAPIDNCAELEKAVTWIYPVAVPATSLLFFFRVRAVFKNNKYVVGFFAFMWLAVLGGCLTITQGVTGMNIGTTKYCINAALATYISAAAILPLINDTLIFVAITWKLMRNSHREYTIKEGVKALVFGHYLLPFSKALLQDGQIYYLTTVTANLVTLIMLYEASVPLAYRRMFTLPNVMLMNIMACRVFRNTKLTSRRQSLLVVQGSVVLPLSIRSGIKFASRSEDSESQLGGSRGPIEVTKTVELHTDGEFRTESNHERNSDAVMV